MEKIGFAFPRDASQQWDGFNEPGVEHFAGSPFRSLGREGTQNTLDARKASPARVEIRRLDVATQSVPDVEELKRAIDCCNAAAGNEGEKAAQFFSSACDILKKPKLSVLQFADYNTHGVRGPCENGTPYFALMKATGQSKKPSDTSIGSFGIGKFAPFTVSVLRTAFLTTVWESEDGVLQHYTQGKSILMSHRDGAATLRGTGFWGIRKNCQPLIGQQNLLPEWLQRDATACQNTGTTLSILGFQPTKGWERILAASIAESFFGAVSRGHLEVVIEGGPSISSSTLASLFADEAIIAAIKDQKEEPETFINSGHFLRTLTSTESKFEETENASLGHCRLHILVGEGLPKKVAILRDGMLITSELDKLRRFGEFKEFAAVLECLSEKGNSLLRSMEPPAHNDFEADRLPTPKQQRAGRVALREIASWVREMLRRHAQDPVDEVTNIDELAEFFGDYDESAKGPRDGDENPRGVVAIRARPLPRRANRLRSDDQGEEFDGDNGSASTGTDGDGGGAGDRDGGTSDKGKDGTGGDSGTGGRGGGSTGGVTLSLRNVRAIVLAPAQRRLAFTPAEGGEIAVQLEDSGADTNRLIGIAAASSGTVVDGRLRLNCSSNTRVIVDVELERSFEGTVRIKANAV